MASDEDWRNLHRAEDCRRSAQRHRELAEEYERSAEVWEAKITGSPKRSTVENAPPSSTPSSGESRLGPACALGARCIAAVVPCAECGMGPAEWEGKG